MFEPAKKFIFLATRKYKLESQALGALVCEKTKKVIASEFPDFKDCWIPKSYKEGILVIEVEDNQYASELYMNVHVLLDYLNEEDLPQKVHDIKIRKR